MHTLFCIALIASVGCVVVALTDLVEEHNAKCPKGELSYSKMDVVSDIPKDQWPAFSPILIPDNFVEDDISKIVGNKVAPDSIDWREKGHVTHVKYQGTCGDCWIFASVAALEALYKRKSGKLEVFSEQNLRDCVPRCPCYGGSPPIAFDFVAIQQGGLLDPEKYYPRSETISKCKFDKPDADNTTVVSHIYFEGEDKLKEVVGTVGPVVVYISANRTKFIESHGEVVYDPDYKKSDPVDHGILVVGYGTDEEGGDYWLLKNSWGIHKGDKGYFRLARNRDGHLGIGTFCFLPV
uniref:Pept_C1 domain-containing protein n=1 Tax=Panagrellus redivivus TaxID=6233 RepID=A0A7E4UZK0_PANRE